MTDSLNTADEIKQIEEIINPSEDPIQQEQDVPAEEERPEERPEEHQENEASAFSQEDYIAQKKKFSKIQRERHRLLAENRRLKEEYETIRTYVDHSNNASMIHYEDSVKLQLDKAKEAKKRALELSDIDGVVDADAELAAVSAKLENLNSWKAQESVRQYQQSRQPQPTHPQYSTEEYYPEEDSEDVKNWLSKNSWFDENSPHYNEEKADAVRAYADSLDFDLRRKGKEHMILTPQYFNKIDQYAAYVSDDQKSSYRSPNIASVKRSAPVNSPTVKKVKLTPDEQDLARRLGIAEENYVKFKEQDIRRQKDLGRPY